MAERELTQAEIDAMVAKTTAEARKATAEALKVEAEAAGAALDLEKKQFDHAKRLADDEHHHVYRFLDSVSEASVTKCVGQLATWHRLDPDCEITLVFNSPGGSVVDGMALFDYLQELRRAGHRVLTKAQGMAASMAGILLQAGDERVMTAESWLLIHQTQFGAIGSFGEVEDRVKWVEQIQNRILDIFANRARESAAEKPISRATLARRWHRTDWWISSDDALRLGLIDRIDSALVVG